MSHSSDCRSLTSSARMLQHLDRTPIQPLVSRWGRNYSPLGLTLSFLRHSTLMSSLPTSSLYIARRRRFWSIPLHCKYSTSGDGMAFWSSRCMPHMYHSDVYHQFVIKYSTTQDSRFPKHARIAKTTIFIPRPNSSSISTLLQCPCAPCPAASALSRTPLLEVGIGAHSANCNRRKCQVAKQSRNLRVELVYRWGRVRHNRTRKTDDLLDFDYLGASLFEPGVINLPKLPAVGIFGDLKGKLES